MAAVDDLLTCAVCLDLFKSPRWLPCHHAYCLQCLLGLVEEESDHITCPECRRDHVVPNNRVEEFPVDGRLEQLIVKFEKLKPVGLITEDWKDSSALSKCECSQPTCRICSTNRAILLETILQESRHLRVDFFTEKQKITKQKLKTLLLARKETLCNLRIKLFAEIEAMVEELEKRKMTLLSRIEEEEKLIVDDLSKLDQADIISDEHESLLADLVDKVLPTESLVSLRVKLSKQRQLMTSLHQIGQNTTLLDVAFNRCELTTMIDSYGEFLTVVDYLNDFTIATTLDGSESGNLLFTRPWGLTVCPFTEDIYVTDNTSVRVYNNNGEYIRHVVTNNTPTGVAFDSTQRVIVASFSEHRVNIYNHDLKLVKSFGLKGSENGQVNSPMGVACDRNDNIYVADRDNSRIQVFTPFGTFLSVIGLGILQNPFCIQINKRQEILVADYKLGQVVIFAKDGTLLKTITGEDDNKLNGPVGICLDDRNRILISDLSSKKIQVYNDDGSHHSTITQPAAAMTSMYGIALTKYGVLFITDHDGNKIHRIVPTQS